jgi:hypothetical protein
MTTKTVYKVNLSRERMYHIIELFDFFGVPLDDLETDIPTLLEKIWQEVLDDNEIDA